MKLSTQHSEAGLNGTIRHVQTGQVINFHFSKGVHALPVEVHLDDRRIEAVLRLEVVATDGDDLDVELRLRAPEALSSAAFDYVPRVSPPRPGGKLDIDGAAMDPDEGTTSLTTTVVVEEREAVFMTGHTPDVDIPATVLPIQQQYSGPGRGAELVDSDEEEDLKDGHPATKVPELPGVGKKRPKR